MQLNKLQTYFFYLIIFVTGAVILVIEIIGARILAPFYGSTIYVWSSLITSTLAALALGYYAGGKLADKAPKINLGYVFTFIAYLY
ncbi:MAG: fused MFS/spermidine synthase [Candidatus Spechtbacterales bacterium]